MYNQESIDALIKRIGWKEPMQPTDIVLSSDNGESLSGRCFDGFNPLVIVENVKASLTNKLADNDTLNEELARLRKEGVLDVLSKVYNQNTLATYAELNGIISINYALDYSYGIIANGQVFDQAIGFGVAIKTLEMLLSTARSNAQTQSNEIKQQQLYQYLEGSFTMQGALVSQGLRAMYAEAIGQLITVLFPVKYPDGYKMPDGNIRPLRPHFKGFKGW